MYFADTNVVSMSDPFKSATRDVKAMSLRPSDVFISTVTVAEIRIGLVRLVRQGAVAKARRLEAWWTQIEHLYAERILPFDAAAAEAAAIVGDRSHAAGHDPGWADIQIAGIAHARGLTILTCNRKHFTSFGVPFIDPSDPPYQ